MAQFQVLNRLRKCYLFSYSENATNQKLLYHHGQTNRAIIKEILVISTCIFNVIEKIHSSFCSVGMQIARLSIGARGFSLTLQVPSPIGFCVVVPMGVFLGSFISPFFPRVALNPYLFVFGTWPVGCSYLTSTG